MPKKTHIDDAQPLTVDEHFQLLLDDRSTIDSEFVKVTPDDLPEWFDERLFKIGQRYQMKNLLGISTGHLSGLLAILAVPDIAEVLIYTKQSATVCLSFRRYAQTLLLMYALYYSDMLAPDSKWFQSLNTIRWKHASVSRKRVKDGLNSIYQKDMAITQFAFVGYVLVLPKTLGLAHATAEDQLGFHHFWRVSAHLLGISDRMNVCRKTVAETIELCTRVMHEIVGTHLSNHLPESRKLAEDAVDGLWYSDVSLNKTAMLKLMHNMTGVEYDKPLDWYSYLNMKQRDLMLYLHGAPYIGVVVRAIFNTILTVAYWMLEHYPVGAYIGFGKVNAQVCPFATTQ